MAPVLGILAVYDVLECLSEKRRRWRTNRGILDSCIVPIPKITSFELAMSEPRKRGDTGPTGRRRFRGKALWALGRGQHQGPNNGELNNWRRPGLHPAA